MALNGGLDCERHLEKALVRLEKKTFRCVSQRASISLVMAVDISLVEQLHFCGMKGSAAQRDNTV